MTIEPRQRSPLGAFYRTPLGAFGSVDVEAIGALEVTSIIQRVNWFSAPQSQAARCNQAEFSGGQYEYWYMDLTWNETPPPWTDTAFWQSLNQKQFTGLTGLATWIPETDAGIVTLECYRPDNPPTTYPGMIQTAPNRAGEIFRETWWWFDIENWPNRIRIYGNKLDTDPAGIPPGLPDFVLGEQVEVSAP